MNNEEWRVTTQENSYLITEVPNVVGLPDHKRKLFRVVNETTGQVHYKGISISRTNRSVERDNMSEEDLWRQMKNDIIEGELRNNNEENTETIIGETITHKSLNPSDGSL